MKLAAQTPTEVLAKVLWWMIHSERVSMLSCEAESRLSFSCRVATEKDDIFASSHRTDVASSFACATLAHVILYWALNRSAAEIENGRMELYSRS